MSWSPIFSRETIEISCTVDIEQTADSFHAYAVPEGVEIRPGDVVTIHDAPSGVAFGERLQKTCRATVVRAGLVQRLWTRASGMLELTELYEVGFLPSEPREETP